ncbi:MAG: hypothetical protein AAFR73_12120 [Pseudomonadota bacterium]
MARTKTSKDPISDLIKKLEALSWHHVKVQRVIRVQKRMGKVSEGMKETEVRLRYQVAFLEASLEGCMTVGLVT